MTKSKWGAILQGEKIDLENWTEALRPPFDPWIEIQAGNVVLRSAAFDELTSGTQVNDRATAYIDRLNGAFAVSYNALPLSLGGILEITADGERRTLIFLKATLNARSNVRAVSQAIGPDGKLVESVAQASEVQRWASVVENDGLLDDALMYFGKKDWFDIYKALECLILKAGDEKKFLALGWESEDEILRLKRTANWGRHARRRYAPPSDPMSMKEARELLGRLIRRALG